jgi:protein SCO1/2
MNTLRKLYVGAVTVAALLAFFGLPQTLLAAEVPADSYYQLDTPLETHRSEQAAFSSFAGESALVSMFYGSCPHVCPMLISTIREIEKQLPTDAREKFKVALISVDPERDDPVALRALAERHDVLNDRWTFARTDEHQTRALAAVLGIKYKALPNGDFNHTTAMILLDASGHEIARSGKLGAPDPAFVEAIRTVLAN